ncbi:TPR repeat protein [Bradyrhizobium elkanii]|uniref:tetratricopeptide repeat protein n=1 Tax=Bradyrhizobium elkanii TaxID=29448 RepID=UPI0015C31C10|nr:tetratricopeptide repeat protein [Bradyrhizobium elkanii]NWL42587.1 sel1 repeat family protein [Bradyrhizobium elkanii]
MIAIGGAALFGLHWIAAGLIGMRACLAVVLLVITAEVVAAGSLEEAKTAHDNGDLRNAERIYSELSSQGDRVAQLQLGLMYDEGHGIPRQHQQAVRWLSVAASQGDPEAPYYLGRIYQDGRGGPKNYARARQWYRVAAERGQTKAAVNLGVTYAFGLGGPINYHAAGQWFLLAANYGDTKAQDNLGVLYQNGEGVRRDYIKAYMWFALAAAPSGEPEAVKHRDQIARLMAPSQIEQAQKLSSEKMYALIRCNIVPTLPCHWR